MTAVEAGLVVTNIAMCILAIVLCLRRPQWDKGER